MPRFRFTVRRMMVAVAALALPLWFLTLLEGNEKANQRLACSSNISQVAKALVSFQLANGHLPSGTRPRAGKPPGARLGWTREILPFIGDSQLYNSLANDPAAVPPDRFPIFECPSNPTGVTASGHGLIHFVGIAGLGTDAPTLPTKDPRAGIFGYDRATRPSDIRDGASTTMMLAETTSANGEWFLGGPSTVRGLDPARRPYIGPNRQFGGTHSGGGNVAFADGSVRFIRERIDPKVFEATSTMAGGESLPANWDR